LPIFFCSAGGRSWPDPEGRPPEGPCRRNIHHPTGVVCLNDCGLPCSRLHPAHWSGSLSHRIDAQPRLCRAWHFPRSGFATADAHRRRDVSSPQGGPNPEASLKPRIASRRFFSGGSTFPELGETRCQGFSPRRFQARHSWYPKANVIRRSRRSPRTKFVVNGEADVRPHTSLSLLRDSTSSCPMVSAFSRPHLMARPCRFRPSEKSSAHWGTPIATSTLSRRQPVTRSGSRVCAAAVETMSDGPALGGRQTMMR